jgi:hypothetical protein
MKKKDLKKFFKILSKDSTFIGNMGSPIMLSDEMQNFLEKINKKNKKNKNKNKISAEQKWEHFQKIREQLDNDGFSDMKDTPYYKLLDVFLKQIVTYEPLDLKPIQKIKGGPEGKLYYLDYNYNKIKSKTDIIKDNFLKTRDNIKEKWFPIWLDYHSKNIDNWAKSSIGQVCDDTKSGHSPISKMPFKIGDKIIPVTKNSEEKMVIVTSVNLDDCSGNYEHLQYDNNPDWHHYTRFFPYVPDPPSPPPSRNIIEGKEPPKPPKEKPMEPKIRTIPESSIPKKE